MEMKNTKLDICRKCWGTGHVHGGDDNSTWSKTCEECRGIGFIRVPMTNADRIRAMTDEELEAFLVNVDLDKEGSPFITDWGKWLQQPAEK